MAKDSGRDVTETGGARKRLQELVVVVDRAAKQLRQLLVEYQRMSKSGTTNDPHAVAAWLRKRRHAIQPISALQPLLDGLIAIFEQEAGHACMRLEADLREALEQGGWSVHGQWPRLYVERVVRVEIHERRGRAVVGDTEVDTLHVPALLHAVAAQVRDLLPAQFEPSRFIETLERCYDRLAAPGQRGVPIWEVYKQALLSNQSPAFWRSGRQGLFHTFGEQRFRACLTMLLERGPLVAADGRELKLLPPLKAEDAMYLFQPAENRFAFVGRLAFVGSGEQRTLL